jgi:hypothetical protein
MNIFEYLKRTLFILLIVILFIGDNDEFSAWLEWFRNNSGLNLFVTPFSNDILIAADDRMNEPLKLQQVKLFVTDKDDQPIQAEWDKFDVFSLKQALNGYFEQKRYNDHPPIEITHFICASLSNKMGFQVKSWSIKNADAFGISGSISCL